MEEFQRIAEALTDPLTVYLIGGGAMSLRDLKGATKDIDLLRTAGFGDDDIIELVTIAAGAVSATVIADTLNILPQDRG
nr:hypothetical protein [Halovenus salina]